MPRKVQALVTHDTLFVTGWGNLDKNLPNSKKTHPGFEMYEGAYGIEVSALGRISFVVPYAHVKSYELAEPVKR